jgi:hypothetical protein
MQLSRGFLAFVAVLAIAIPTVALAAGGGPASLPGPAKAYGVICTRDPYNTQPGTSDFSQCVKALAKGTHGTETASDAARTACRQATPPLPGDQFGNCVSTTKTLVQGLRALHNH